MLSNSSRYDSVYRVYSYTCEVILSSGVLFCRSLRAYVVLLCTVASFELVLYKVHNISKYKKNMTCANTTEVFGLKLKSS
jgi:hypothetical protein